jgi:hypothetical protein
MSADRLSADEVGELLETKAYSLEDLIANFHAAIDGGAVAQQLECARDIRDAAARCVELLERLPAPRKRQRKTKG